MNFPFYHVDAFANETFGGNQAAVCILNNELSPEIMQKIAAENNLPISVFVNKKNDKIALRWFSPRVEIPLCGHGTLAASHVLWEEGLANSDKIITFNTQNGNIVVRKLEGNWIELDFPSFESYEASLPPLLSTEFPDPVAVFCTDDRLLIELKSEEEIRTFKPDLEKIKSFKIIITSRADPGSVYDFISRYFALPVGILEDPVTGSAHSSLSVYWSEKLGKNNMFAFQASQRGGEMKVSLSGNRSLLAGKAITVIKGNYKLSI